VVSKNTKKDKYYGTAEKLWEALTSGDFSEKYWFGFRIEIELRVGGKVRILQVSGALVITQKFAAHVSLKLMVRFGRILWMLPLPAQRARVFKFASKLGLGEVAVHKSNELRPAPGAE